MMRSGAPFPSGGHEFILGEEAGSGRCSMASLFSPVLEFAHQAAAPATARAALDMLSTPVRGDRPLPLPALTVRRGSG